MAFVPRVLARAGGELLTNHTNDGWFEHSVATDRAERSDFDTGAEPSLGCDYGGGVNFRLGHQDFEAAKARASAVSG